MPASGHGYRQEACIGGSMRCCDLSMTSARCTEVSHHIPNLPAVSQQHVTQVRNMEPRSCARSCHWYAWCPPSWLSIFAFVKLDIVCQNTRTTARRKLKPPQQCTCTSAAPSRATCGLSHAEPPPCKATLGEATCSWLCPKGPNTCLLYTSPSPRD